MTDKIEMNENELVKVAGGFEDYEVVETRYNFTKGDTFHSGAVYYVIRNNYSGARSDDKVDCYVYIEHGGMYEIKLSDSIYVSYLVSDYTFVGNSIINESNTR